MQFPLVKGKAILLVEGEIDTILVKQSGLVHNVWGAMGSSLSKDQLIILQQIEMPLILVGDNDKAGDEFTRTIYGTCRRTVPIYMMKNYYKCNDPAELYEKNLLKKAIRSIERI